MSATAETNFCRGELRRLPPGMRPGVAAPTRLTFHAQVRAVERLRLSAAHLSDMLAAGAFVCVQQASEKTTVEGRLLWSPPDKAFVLAWQDSQDGDVLTCMPFAGSHQETKMLESRGPERVQHLCQRARYLAVAWLLNSAVQDHTQSTESTQPNPEAEALPQPPDSEVAAPVVSNETPAPTLELHFCYGKREPLPMSSLPAEFLRDHPVTSQRTALRFLQAFLASPWCAQFLVDILANTRWSLDQLQDISIQRWRRKGNVLPRVAASKSEAACLNEDLAEGRALYAAVAELDWDLFSPLGPEHPFFEVDA